MSSIMQGSEEENIGLLDRSKDDDGQEESGAPQNQSPLSRNRSGPTVVVVAILTILMALDIVAYAYISRLIFSQIGLDDLKFQSSYVGLDQLYKTGTLKPSHYNRTINLPRSAVQVYEADPDKVSPQGTHQWLSDFGTLAPPDRHLQVSTTVRTLLQFRVMDFGMERCSLALRLPGTSTTLPHPPTSPSPGDGGSSPNITLHVCQLDTARINLGRISWNNRPRCRKDMMTVLRGARETEFESEPWACVAGSHISFEVSCAPENPSCHVDVWSNQNATWGIFMYQYQTV